MNEALSEKFRERFGHLPIIPFEGSYLPVERARLQTNVGDREDLEVLVLGIGIMGFRTRNTPYLQYKRDVTDSRAAMVILSAVEGYDVLEKF